MSGGSRSFDGLAADYDRFASLEPPTILEWLPTHLPTLRQRALDAGCGSGRQTLALANQFDQVVGVDISGPLIEIARRKRVRRTVQFCTEDLMAFNDPGGFDLVFSSTTIHHMPDLEAALLHLRGLVRPAGTIALVDNVAPRPNPPRWIYVLGAVRDFPADVRRLGWTDARWLFGFRTSVSWLDHLMTDRYLSRSEFERRYGAIFPAAEFHQLGYAHGLVWRKPG